MTARTDADYNRSTSIPPHTEVDAARAEHAITNLSAYALGLDLEYHQVSDRLLERLQGDVAADELRALLRERDELEAAREAFRQSVAALHDLTRGEPLPDQR